MRSIFWSDWCWWLAALRGQQQFRSLERNNFLHMASCCSKFNCATTGLIIGVHRLVSILCISMIHFAYIEWTAACANTKTLPPEYVITSRPAGKLFQTDLERWRWRPRKNTFHKRVALVLCGVCAWVSMCCYQTVCSWQVVTKGET